MMGVIAALVLVACLIPFTDAVVRQSCIGECAVHDYQYCVTNHDYLCADNEFCTVSQKHHDAPGRHMPHLQCHSNTQLEHCWTLHANNAPICDPFYAHPPRACTWCCSDGECLRNMAQGVFPVKPHSNATQTPHPTTFTAGTTQTAATTATAGTSQAAAGNSTDCYNFYVGDCGVDFANRCDEAIVQQICPSYCGVCGSPALG